MDWKTFTDKIRAGDEYVTAMATGMCHESRARVQSDRIEGVPGIGRVYVGHTPQFGGIRRLGNVYYLDSGAVFGDIGKPYGHLTMVQPAMATEEIIAPLADRPLQLIDLRASDTTPSNPFTNYCIDIPSM